jgi:hypothetical protein
MQHLSLIRLLNIGISIIGTMASNLEIHGMNKIEDW